MTKEQAHEMGFFVTGERKQPPFMFPCVGCNVRCDHEQYYSCFGLHDNDWFPDFNPNKAHEDIYEKVIGKKEPAKITTEAGIQYLLFEM